MLVSVAWHGRFVDVSYRDGVRGDENRDEESEERRDRGGQGREKV